jgi:UDP-glucose 4-epimerase
LNFLQQTVSFTVLTFVLVVIAVVVNNLYSLIMSALSPTSSSSSSSSSSRRIILVTGGAGYIGSHTTLELLNANYDVIVVDNMSNASPEALRRVEELAKRKVLAFHQVDLRDVAAMNAIFDAHKIDAVIHFAALKAVGESVRVPLKYYDNNIAGAVALLNAMDRVKCHRLVFSSSATVYGDNNVAPFREDLPLSANNPYGETKFVTEMLLRAMAKANDHWQFSMLRYFNPIGAHPSGLIGEDPAGVPQNLLPFVEQVAVGIRPKLTIFGDKYPTRDGTCVRDYIHVVDLALGHVAALAALKPGAEAYNLGTGGGHTVLEVVRAFERVNGVKVPFEIGPPRDGDIAESYADVSKATKLLNFTATHTLDDMVQSAWKWRSNNPHGYAKK